MGKSETVNNFRPLYLSLRILSAFCGLVYILVGISALIASTISDGTTPSDTPIWISLSVGIFAILSGLSGITSAAFQNKKRKICHRLLKSFSIILIANTLWLPFLILNTFSSTILSIFILLLIAAGIWILSVISHPVIKKDFLPV